MDLAAIIGAVSGVASLLGLVYLLGVWKGGVDSKLRDITRLLSQYPPSETALMTKTLWDIYVVDALRNRPDLAEHSSAYKLTKVGEDLIPEYMKPLLERIPHNPLNREDIATGYLVVKYVGLDSISKMAEDKQLNVQEAIAILSTYFVNNKGV